jgi:hypothetical protein
MKQLIENVKDKDISYIWITSFGCLSYLSERESSCGTVTAGRKGMLLSSTVIYLRERVVVGQSQQAERACY